MGDVGKVKQALGWLESRLDKTDRRIPQMSNAELIKKRNAEEATSRDGQPTVDSGGSAGGLARRL